MTSGGLVHALVRRIGLLVYQVNQRGLLKNQQSSYGMKLPLCVDYDASDTPQLYAVLGFLSS
jgi:hypothetical protein